MDLPPQLLAGTKQLPCHELPGDLFFAESGTQVGLEVLRAACGRCPMLAECASWALRHEKHGFWGGTTELERRRTRRRHGIRLEEPAALVALHPDTVRRRAKRLAQAGAGPIHQDVA